MNEIAKRFDEAITAYAQWLIRWRWPVILVTIALAATAGYGAKNLAFKNDYRVFFSEDNPQLLAFEEIQNTYTKNDNIMFVITPKSGDVFTPEVLDVVENLTNEAWQLPFSIRVDSLSNYQNTYAEADDLIVEDLVFNATDLNAEQLEYIKSIALNEPLLVNRLVSPNAGVTAVNVTFQMPEKDLQEVPLAAGVAREMLAKYEAQYPFVDIRLTGTVMLNNAFPESSIKDGQSLVPAMYGIIVLAMYLLLRSITGTLTTVLVIIFSVVTGMGIAGWIGINLTPPSASAPTIITTLAVADAIHVLITMFASMRHGMTKNEALVDSIRLNMQPIFLTSITTAIGFLTMNFSDAPPFRDLGNITAIGVIAAWIYSVTLLPALISLLPIKPKKTTDGFSDWMDRIADLVVTKKKPVFIVSALIAVGLLAAIPQNELNDEFVKYFDERVEFRRDSDYTVDNLTGLYQLQYSLPAEDSGGVSEPEYLRNTEKFANWLEQQPEVIHVNTITDVFTRLNKNMHADDPSYYRLPDDRQLAAQYLLLYELSLPYGLDLNNQINVDKSATQLIASIEDLSSVQIRDLAASSENWLRENMPSMFTHAVSPAVMFSHISQRNINSMITGTLIGIFIISLILIVALRSLKIGTLSLVPNLLPGGMAFGVWALTVGQVNIAVSVVLGMTLG
ncbi:MAG: MMPL family transporter, partial [Gammaproteobacteria bacterium]|nr:MMPL family transporter [Gammaproteobacteria bacterium]